MSSRHYATPDTHLLLQQALGDAVPQRESKLFKLHWRPHEVALGLLPLLAWRVKETLQPGWNLMLPADWSLTIDALLPGLWMILFPLVVARRRGVRGVFSRRSSEYLAHEFWLAAPLALCLAACLWWLAELGVLGAAVLHSEFLARAPNDQANLLWPMLAAAYLLRVVGEGVFFRGMTLHCFRRSSGLLLALMVQAALSALMYGHDLPRFCAVFVLALVLGLICHWRRSLTASLIVHMLVAAAALAIGYRDQIVLAVQRTSWQWLVF